MISSFQIWMMVVMSLNVEDLSPAHRGPRRAVDSMHDGHHVSGKGIYLAVGVVFGSIEDRPQRRTLPR